MSSMTEFMQIVHRSYEPEEIEACEDWADEMFRDLDCETADNLTWDASRNFSLTSNHDEVPYDWEREIEDWDFPDPPEFLS